MIVRIPNPDVCRWLIPGWNLSPRTALEVDVCWDEELQAAYIVPYTLVDPLAIPPDDGIVHKYSPAEREAYRMDIELKRGG